MPRNADTTAVAAWNLMIDAMTAEVVTALRAAGAEPMLLKGPTLPHWLGADLTRAYVDCDLLVAPTHTEVAERVLAGLGFRRHLEDVDLEEHWPHPAVAWQRGKDELIDLHRTIWGAGAPPERVWETLTARRSSLRLARLDVAIPDVAAAALLLALHAAKHGSAHDRPLAELNAALRRLDVATWKEAASLAGRLEAEPAFAAGLRLDPVGRSLADDLGLPDRYPAGIALAAGSASHSANTLERLFSADGARAKAAFVAHRVVPPATWMRAGYPLARRGRAGLAVSYAWRLVAVPVRLVRALPTWHRAHRSAPRTP
jgi:putative nucleotidyltransferase-like protein